MNEITEKLAASLDEVEKLAASGLPETGASEGNSTEKAIANLSPLSKLVQAFENNPWIHAGKIRVLQHVACSGGTLFGKCLASMPNTVLLSEVNPMSEQLFMFGEKPEFCPTDIISLARLAKVPDMQEFRKKLFPAEIKILEKHLRLYGQRLVLREHSHSSYMLDNSPNSATISELLSPRFDVLSVVTVRHPLDSYLSLRHNGWIHFSPGSLDEYSRRYQKFIAHTNGSPIFKYEDLLKIPRRTMEQICACFKIPFNKDFEDYIELAEATGDSGRSSIHIKPRERRSIDKDLKKEARTSKAYAELCDHLEYDPW